jgi:hypothetical protein
LDFRLNLCLHARIVDRVLVVVDSKVPLIFERRRKEMRRVGRHMFEFYQSVLDVGSHAVKGRVGFSLYHLDLRFEE